jgi:hypothetical protein
MHARIITWQKPKVQNAKNHASFSWELWTDINVQNSAPQTSIQVAAIIFPEAKFAAIEGVGLASFLIAEFLRLQANEGNAI